MNKYITEPTLLYKHYERVSRPLLIHSVHGKKDVYYYVVFQGLRRKIRLQRINQDRRIQDVVYGKNDMYAVSGGFTPLFCMWSAGKIILYIQTLLNNA